ncbi:MAG: Crp/Fnr family transcriptional regulator, partial [Chloroflexota bacterium]|nr:Crp/Fnr family transcriptional regulator [Chloroflexota bacterium]
PSMDPRVRDIRDIAPFSALPRNERIAVASSSRFDDWRHGERLFQARTSADEVVILLHGTVRLFRALDVGHEATISILAPGHIVDIGGLAGGASRNIIAEAVGTARTIHLPTSAFLALGSRYPSFFEELASALLLRPDALYTDAAGSPTAPLAARVLDILHRVAHPASPQADRATIQPLAHRLTQAEIARFVGANRSSVARARATLEEEGLVCRERGHVTGVYNGAATKTENEQLHARHRR